MQAHARFGWAMIILGCQASAAPPRPVSPVGLVAERAAVEILPRGEPWVAGAERDGRLDLVVGGLRVQALDDDLRLADDRFARPIVRAVRATRGWVFVAEDGACGASATFLGPLRRVGNLPGFRRTSYDSRGDGQQGRIGLVDREGRGWTSDGGDLTRVASLPEVELRNLLFADERQGLAIVDGGAFLVTDDGGTSWRPVPGEERDVEYVGVGGGRFVSAGRRLDALYGAGGLTEAADRERTDLLPRWDEARFVWRLVAREPRWVDLLGGEVVGGRLRVQGSVSSAEVDVRSGRQGPLPSDGEPDPHHRVSVAYVVFEGHHNPRAILPSIPDPLAITDHGPSGYRRLTLSREIAAVHGSAGECALVSLAPEGLGWVPLDTDHTENLPVAVLLASGRVVEAGVNPAGVVTAVLRGNDDDDPHRSYAVGPIGGLIVTRDLPPGLTHAAFADVRRGLAWSSPPLRLSRTLDGGATWHDVPLPVDGEYSAAPAVTDADGAPRAEAEDPWRGRAERCTQDRCLVGQALAVWGWGPIGAAPRPALAVRSEAPLARGGDAHWRLNGRLPRLRCEGAGAATPLPTLSATVPPGVAAQELNWIGPDGEVRGSFWINPSGQIQAAFAWRGADDRGAFVGRSQPVAIDLLREIGSRDFTSLVLRPARVTRGDLATFVVPLEGNGFWHVVQVADRSPTARSESFSESLMVPLEYLTSLQADGLVAMPAYALGGNGRDVLVADLGTGVGSYRTAHLRFAGSPDARAPGPLAIARRDNEVGVAVLSDSPDRRLTYYPMRPGGAPSTLPWADVGAVAPCPPATAPGAVALTLPDPRFADDPAPLVDPPIERAAELLTLEVGPSGACLRALSRTSGGAVIRVAAQADGSLTGSEFTANSTRPLRCVAR